MEIIFREYFFFNLYSFYFNLFFCLNYAKNIKLFKKTIIFFSKFLKTSIFFESIHTLMKSS